jgi:deoxyadenosine/deoxycytidine kinase
MLERFRHIVIEGPIGVGKTTLARRLAQHLGAELVLEKPEENPFLERFYADGSRYALQTQLFFLFQRLEQMRELAQPGMFSRGVVSDFLFAKDALFAALTLSPEEHRLYRLIHAQTAAQVPQPDLVIWLQASPDALVERIRGRGLRMERGITRAYLQALCEAYGEHFRQPGGPPLLAVGTEYFNPASRNADFELLLKRIAAFAGPREYFDPVNDWQGG